MLICKGVWFYQGLKAFIQPNQQQKLRSSTRADFLVFGLATWQFFNICSIGFLEACLFYCKFFVVFFSSRKSLRFLAAPQGRTTLLRGKFALSSRRHNTSTYAVNCGRFQSTCSGTCSFK